MKPKYSVPLVTGGAIALLGVGVVANTRVDVAEAFVDCVQELQHPLLNDESELRELRACERESRKTGLTLLEVLAIFGLFGWGAGAMGYVAGKKETEQVWRQWEIDRAKSQAAESGRRSSDGTSDAAKADAGGA